MRVIESIRADIVEGRLKPGDQLPTRQQMRERYGIAAMTAARVVRTLAEEGLVVSDSGRGVFVADSQPGRPARSPRGGDRLEQLEARVKALEEWARKTETFD
jgi:DNA-binding GntR family transcriptional regulator